MPRGHADHARTCHDSHSMEALSSLIKSLSGASKDFPWKASSGPMPCFSVAAVVCRWTIKTHGTGMKLSKPTAAYYVVQHLLLFEWSFQSGAPCVAAYLEIDGCRQFQSQRMYAICYSMMQGKSTHAYLHFAHSWLSRTPRSLLNQ